MSSGSKAKLGLFAVILPAILIVSAGSAALNAFAEECIGYNGIVTHRRGGCVSQKGGGGDVPVPFGLNSKAELADGEEYILSGRVRVMSRASAGTPRIFFEVDLAAHPWLASRKRRMNPRYAVEGSVGDWLPYNGQRVKFACRAVYRMVHVNDYGPEQMIYLQGVQPGNESY